MLEALAVGLMLAQAPAEEKEEKTCITSEQVLADYKSLHLQVRQLAGDELKAFNAAYSKEFKKEAPPTDLLLLVERGHVTGVYSFAQGCLFGEGKAPTEIIHGLMENM